MSKLIKIIAAAITLSLTVLFKISTIEVTGTSRYSVEDIIKESGISEGNNLFLINGNLSLCRFVSVNIFLTEL